MPLRHRRPHYAAWAPQLRLLRTYGVRTTILRRPSLSAFRCIFGPIPRQARMFLTHFLKIQIRGFLSWKRIMISFKFELLVNVNVNHKVMNGQYWKLHMIVLFRSSWYKYHTSFRFYQVNYVIGNYIFPKVFTDIHQTSYFECGHLITGIINFNLLVPTQYRRYFVKFYAYPDSNPTAMLRAPWATSLRCHGALGVPPATLRRVCCDAMATCFRGDLTALVLSMFKTWWRPRRPWRPYCDLQRCHGALQRSHNDPAAISGDLADFADRSEVAVLCDWGITWIKFDPSMDKLSHVL